MLATGRGDANAEDKDTKKGRVPRSCRQLKQYSSNVLFNRLEQIPAEASKGCGAATFDEAIYCTCHLEKATMARRPPRRRSETKDEAKDLMRVSARKISNG
jgi:hypothetical protein